ncbi:Eukaryotic Initiation Factor [Trichostrongylus colubriformis]|uniref:Translation initiation factor eIF2B subunit beta n=1 Tax=Trichostrongylus colubriformis TaxID=6319 RepID=A0AAN8IIS1_TRICO
MRFVIHETVLVMTANELEEHRKSFTASLRRKCDSLTSYDFALETLQYLRKVIIYEKYETIIDLIDVLTSHGRWLYTLVPTELVIRNVVMMVKKLARDESVRLITGEPTSAFDSLNKLWIKTEDQNGAASAKKLKKGLIQAINEVASEMSLCCENIATRAGELVNLNDVLVVHNLSGSPTLAAFLAAARAIRKHRVLSVVHSDDFDSTPDFASPIQLCDVGSKMCEVTKVVLPGAAVFPDGSCLVPAGGLSICLSAQRHSVPVYVLAGFYKITPFFVPNLMMVNPNKAPGVSFKHSIAFSGLVEIPRPTFDHIPAALVTLYVSNSACILPSHVYRLIGDYYHPEDVAEC